jgi:hypothetical protein
MVARVHVSGLALMGLVATTAACASSNAVAPEPGARRSSRNPWADDLVAREHRAGAPVTSVPVPEGIAPQSLRWAVESALSERHWDVGDSAPGRVQASVYSNGSAENARIAVTYGPGFIQIEKLAGSVRPERYARWVRLLVTNINKHVAQLGPARAAPPAASAALDHGSDEDPSAGPDDPRSEVPSAP